MSRPLYDLKEENESIYEAELLDFERQLSIDSNSESLSQDLLADRERSQSERGDGTGTVTLNRLTEVDHRRKAIQEDECPERAGGKKKKPTPKEQKENLVFVTDFGEKISLFLPGFDVDTGEMTAEERVSETVRDGDDLLGSGRSSRDGVDLSDGGSHSLPEIFETEERKQTESLETSKRSDTQKNPESEYQPEEDEVESVRERLEAQMREEMERLKAKAKKKSDKEKRRQQEYQDSAKEELKRELMKPRSDRTFLSGNECQSEVDRLKAQMRQEVEQLKPELDLELRAEGKKVTEGQEEREQLWRLYQEEVHHSVKLDYEEKLEKLRAEHWTELTNVQQKCRNEASAQRDSLLSALQEEKERMQASHAQHLQTLRSGFEEQKQQLQLEHSRRMSELQRREEHLQRRAEELKNTEDTALRMQDKLDHITEASEKLRQERDELRQELQKVAAWTEEARDLLQKTQLERDAARTDEVLLKVERDKAVQMCAAAVEEREQLKRTYENLGRKYSQEKGRKGPSSSLQTRVDRRKTQKAERKTSSSEDGGSSTLTDDAEGLADSPAPDYVHEGCRWKTSSTLGRGGGRKMDTEQAVNGKNQRKDLEETEDELQEQMEALNNLKRDRDLLKKELEHMIEEKTKENMDMALVKTEVLMKERDRIMTQRIREEKEELEKKLERLQKKCSLFSHSRRGKEQNKGLHRLFRHERTTEEEARGADSSSLSPEPDSAEESCCYVSNRIHSQFPNLGRDGASVMKSSLQTGPLGMASSPWIGGNHRVPAGDCGPRGPGYSRRGRLLQGTNGDRLPIAAVKPTHSLHVSPSVHHLQFRQSAVGVGSNRVERLVKSSRRWLEMHGKDVSAPLLTRQDTLNKNSLFF